MGQQVDKLGTDADLHALDGIEHYETKTTIESVATPDQFKGRALEKRIVEAPEWIPVAAPPIVADAWK